ncbi:MAG TPA: hypothetical protein VF174_00225 [Micromonosporaceae bacterium]
MYAVEMCFLTAGHGIAPSQEVLAASARRNATDLTIKIEHLRVSKARREFFLVAFISASGMGHARRAARLLGAMMTADIRQIHLFSVRVWQDPRLNGEEQVH